MNSAAQIAILIVVAGALSALAVLLMFQRTRDPSKREHRRRMTVAQFGRMHDGNITDIHDGAIFYSYVLSGVEYTASQDVSQLADRLPPDSQSIIGPVTIKYLPRNPANSIVVCESWAGFRNRPPISKGA